VPDEHPIVEHWNIIVSKTECPYLYPRDNGCIYNGRDQGPCSYENCPIVR